jgi:SAM-dependent methyltransferase
MRLCPRCGKSYGTDSLSPSCQFCGHVLERIEGYLAFAPELADQSEGFEASYFDRLSRLEPGSFWFNARNQLLIWALQRYFPNASSFLEIGCGTGFVLAGIERALPHLALSGSEVFTAGLSIAARRTSRADLFQMDARHIPFADHFDVIGAFDVLEHIREDEQVLSQMHRAVRQNGGGIMITVPQHPFLWSKSDEFAHHVRRYRAGELKAKLERAGFKIVRVTSFVSLLLPLMLAARLKQNFGGCFDARTEFEEVPDLANRLLGGVMSLERTIIKAGLSFPAGGSLLFLAKSV